MRLDRFESFLAEQVRTAGAPIITDCRTYSDAGYTGPSVGPYGLILTLASGTHVGLAIARTSPPAGDDFTAPEEPVTGSLAALADRVAATAEGGAVDLPGHLRWLITSAAHPEIAAVEPTPTTIREGGITVRCHSGAGIFLRPETLDRARAGKDQG